MYGVKTGPFDSIKDAEQYFDGVADGLRVHAWQRDGVMYVGTTGSTLAEAQNELEGTRRVVVGRLKVEADEALAAAVKKEPAKVEPAKADEKPPKPSKESGSKK